MASTGRFARLACSGIFVIAVALPGTGLGAAAQRAALTKAAEDSLRPVSSAVLPDSREPSMERAVFRPEPALLAPRAAPSEPKPYAMLASEPKPYAMLLAGLGLIVFIARRRTRALNAAG